MRRVFAAFLLLFSTTILADKYSAPFVGNTIDGVPCVGRGQGYGPFDYLTRYSKPDELRRVETYHFTRNVEALIKGESGTDLEADLTYTIMAWPNHHRALNSMIRYDLRLEEKGRKTNPPPECWFQRAINYSPKDANSYVLYGIYLHKKGLLPLAQEQYGYALKLKPNHPEINYNYGLLLVEMEDYDAALEHAKKAYDAGYPLPGLRNKLTELGIWE